MTYTKHLANLVAAREALVAIGQFKPSYDGVFQAVTNTLKKLAATEAQRKVSA